MTVLVMYTHFIYIIVCLKNILYIIKLLKETVFFYLHVNYKLLKK